MNSDRFRIMVTRTPGESDVPWTFARTKTVQEARRAAVGGLRSPEARVAVILATYGKEPRVIGAYELRGTSILHALFENSVRP